MREENHRSKLPAGANCHAVRWLAAVVLVLSLSPSSVIAGPGPVEVEPRPDPARLFGQVTTRDGNQYQGYLRWRGGQMFWDEPFVADKDELPYVEKYLGDGKRSFEVFGRKFAIGWGPGQRGRQLSVPFGYIDRMQIEGSDRVELVLRDGVTIPVDDGPDIGGSLVVIDPNLGEIEIGWREIEIIQMMEAPPGTSTPGPWITRLHGRVTSSQGSFSGFIRWDRQEKLAHEELDGDVDDVSLSIAMGRIRSIEPIESRASKVTLNDGRVFELSGTNDVNDENRGILIEDPEHGLVTVRWPAFARIDFEPAPTNGVAYRDFVPRAPLRGSVRRKDGVTLTGAIVYDLDESYGWENLDGRSEDVSYSVPFHLVRSIERGQEGKVSVVLEGGSRVELASGQDVSDDNGGVLVVPATGEAVLVPWQEVARIEFDSDPID